MNTTIHSIGAREALLLMLRATATTHNITNIASIRIRTVIMITSGV